MLYSVYSLFVLWIHTSNPSNPSDQPIRPTYLTYPIMFLSRPAPVSSSSSLSTSNCSTTPEHGWSNKRGYGHTVMQKVDPVSARSSSTRSDACTPLSSTAPPVQTNTVPAHRVHPLDGASSVSHLNPAALYPQPTPAVAQATTQHCQTCPRDRPMCPTPMSDRVFHCGQ